MSDLSSGWYILFQFNYKIGKSEGIGLSVRGSLLPGCYV